MITLEIFVSDASHKSWTLDALYTGYLQEGHAAAITIYTTEKHPLS